MGLNRALARLQIASALAMNCVFVGAAGAGEEGDDAGVAASVAVFVLPPHPTLAVRGRSITIAKQMRERGIRRRVIGMQLSKKRGEHVEFCRRDRIPRLRLRCSPCIHALVPRRTVANPVALRFGVAVRETRQRRGETLEQVAHRIIRMDAKYLGEIERGWHAPTIPTAKRIADALEVELADLVQAL
jgi:XRE family transcriptional regulator, regulator of sulfur utilization